MSGRFRVIFVKLVPTIYIYASMYINKIEWQALHFLH